MLLETHVPAGTKDSSQIAYQNLPPQNICPFWLLRRVFKRFKFIYKQSSVYMCVCVCVLANMEKNKHEKIFIWLVLGVKFQSKPT